MRTLHIVTLLLGLLVSACASDPFSNTPEQREANEAAWEREARWAEGSK